MQAAGFLMHFGMSLLMVILYRKSKTVIYKMTTPSKYVVSYDETFCILSLYIIRVVQCELLVIIIREAIFSLFYVIPTRLFYKDCFQTCSCDQPYTLMGTIRNVFYLFLEFTKGVSNLAVMTLQGMEWYSMLNIILQQNKRNVNEILYDFNAENMQDEIDRTDRH